MRILFLGFGKIKYMPYLHIYLEAMKSEKIELLYWDRDGLDDLPVPECISKSYCYRKHMSDTISLKKKVPYILGYRKLALSILRKNKYDRVVVLHSTPGLSVIDYLTRHYKNKYLLDYRDVTHERNGVYRALIHKLVNGSYATFISSGAFVKFLPDNGRIHIAHNILLDSLDNRNIRRMDDRNVSVIRIRFWGLIRHFEVNARLIDRLKNDERFELHYHGRDQGTGSRLSDYCKENNIRNVFFHGEYLPHERYLFAAHTDLIHNLYNNDIVIQNATGNKYYDGITMYIPQLCTKESYMGDLISQHGLGLVCDPTLPTFADDVYKYYQDLDWAKFENNCDDALQTILNEYKAGSQVIMAFLKESNYTD